jgi:sporulation protein YlmC with PRC-barrel domain
MTIRASTLLGAAIVDREGRRLGKIRDLILDAPRPANICYALVDLEQTPDEAERTVAVPWSVLQPSGDQRPLVLGVSREALRRLKGLARA